MWVLPNSCFTQICLAQRRICCHIPSLITSKWGGGGRGVKIGGSRVVDRVAAVAEQGSRGFSGAAPGLGFLFQGSSGLQFQGSTSRVPVSQ